MSRLHHEPFCNVRFDEILILLGLAWHRWRKAQSQTKQAGGEETWKPPESFIRKTLKYWIRPDQVVRLKARILEQMPYLIFGSSMRDQEGFLDPMALLDVDYASPGVVPGDTDTLLPSSQMEESQLLSSIYFD